MKYFNRSRYSRRVLAWLLVFIGFVLFTYMVVEVYIYEFSKVYLSSMYSKSSGRESEKDKYTKFYRSLFSKGSTVLLMILGKMCGLYNIIREIMELYVIIEF